MTRVRAFLIVLSLFLLLILISFDATASNWVVPVDAPTIAAGLDSAMAGDTVTVQCGTYHENFIEMTPGVLLRSEAGNPACVTIDGDSLNKVLYFLTGDNTSKLDGLTFTGGGMNNFGGAIQCWGASPTISNCIFDGNTAVQQGGAISFENSNASVTGCVFANNRADYTYAQGGAVYMYKASVTMSSCLFVNNFSSRYGGALSLNGSGTPSSYYTPHFTSCTFVDNSAPGDGSAVYVQNWVSPSFDKTIIAFNGFRWLACTPAPIPVPAFSCSNVYGNIGGDWAPYCVAAQENVNGNISADPLFCDLGSNDYRLDIESPCLASCGQMGAFGIGCGAEPEVIVIGDVPNDQGRQVRIKWARSPYDAPGDTVDVDAYEVYRAQGGFMTVTRSDAPGSKWFPQPVRADGWDFIVSVPAHGDSIYQVVTPTLCDSTISQGQCWSSFFVRATTTDRFLFYDSEVDSGYSLDNLAPGAPSSFTVAYSQVGGNELAWDEAVEEDFQYFRIYRGSTPDFVPTGNDVVQEMADVGWVDAAGGPQDFYKISAVDHAGNEGPRTGPDVVTGIEEDPPPVRSVLYQNTPNPFNPGTFIHYDLAEMTPVTLQIYDVSGRLVQVLKDGVMEPRGRYSVEWNGRNRNGAAVATGVYFYRLRAGAYNATRRMVMIR